MLKRVRGQLVGLPGVSAALDVQRRYTEERGSALAASITLYGFLALFAVTALAIAALGFLSAGGAHVARDLPNRLGVSGEAARLVHRAVDSARRSRAVATVVGLVGLAWTGTSLAIVVGDAYNAAWHVDRRGLVDRARGLAWLAGAVVPIAAGAAATALWSPLPGFFAPLVVCVSIATNAALFAWTSWILPNRRVPVGALIPAAVLGGVALEALKVLGAYAVPHLVARSSEIYGTIGVVFALLAWLLVFGRVVVYVPIVEARRWEHTHGDQRVELEVPALPAR
ncbi:MAG TPA: YihY/virulence factor BrkB family protein [Acidimicrobiia bacterium]